MIKQVTLEWFPVLFIRRTAVTLKIEKYKYHNWRLCQLSLDLAQSVVSHFPLEIQAEVTTFCNLACTMCVRPFVSPRPAHLPPEVLSKLYPIFPAALKLVPFGGGEPLLYPHFIELVDKAKQAGVQVVFNTNGSMLTEQVSQFLVSRSVDMVSISLDAATEETYRVIRIGAEFQKVIANITTLNAIKQQQATSLPAIGLAYVPMADNVREIPQFLALSREIGAQHLSFEPLYVPDPEMNPAYKQFYQDQNLSNIPETELDTLFIECAQLSRQLELSISPPDYFSKWLPANQHSDTHNQASLFESVADQPEISIPSHPSPVETPVACTVPWTSIYVNTSGLVQTCCFSSRLFGDLKTQEIAEIWNGSEFRDYRQQFIQGRPPAECKVCLGNSRNKPFIPGLSASGLWRSWDETFQQTLPHLDSEQLYSTWHNITEQTLARFEYPAMWSAWNDLTERTFPYFPIERLIEAWKNVSQAILSRIYHHFKFW